MIEYDTEPEATAGPLCLHGAQAELCGKPCARVDPVVCMHTCSEHHDRGCGARDDHGACACQSFVF